MKPDALYALVEGTWPPARSHRAGPWTVRDGQGGGKRVSAVTAAAAWTGADIPLAETEQAALGQDALFMIRDGDDALDAALAARGYRVVDPVVAYAAPVALLADPPPDPMGAFPHWPPLGIALDIWAETGIGPARIAVMHRAVGPKAAILSRRHDRPTGAAFVALQGKAAMLHALEVLPALRRQGSAHMILRMAAFWAQEQGADTLALVVTRANDGARALYASLGMQVVGQYHYRLK